MWRAQPWSRRCEARSRKGGESVVVRLRVIQGGKKEERARGSWSGLYRATSIGSLTKDGIDYYNVKFNW
jgi:hypothetical protein